MSLFKRLFGWLKADTPAPAAHQRAAAPARAAPPPAPRPPEPRVFLGWSELIDARSRIGGYLLRPQSLTPGTGMSASALHEALAHEHVQRVASQRRLIVPMDAALWSAADFRSLAGPGTVFLIQDLDRLPAAEQVALAETFAAAGLKLGASWHHPDTPPPPADVLLVDPQTHPLPALEAAIGRLRRLPKPPELVADNVLSWSEHRLYGNLGFSASIGSFATSRDDSQGEESVSASRLVVIEMLNQIRAGAEHQEIAQTAMRDPAVVVKLLDMANSPIYGLPRKVAGISEALMLLGHDALYRWLSLSLFQIGTAAERDQTLLTLALCRASLLQGLASGTDRRLADELFLVGLLSLLDVLLGQPLAAVLEHIRLPDDVAAALLRNEGPYARYLQLALMLERCRLDQAVILAGAMGIDADRLLTSYREALSWAAAEAGGH